MALYPSEFYRYENPSDEADLSELKEPSDERAYSESEGEAQDTDQDGVSDSQESNDHVPRWCREEFKEQFKAGVSGAHTRKRKQLASSQKSPPPPKHSRKSDGKECDENDFQEMKYLLQKLCKKMEENERYLKEIQQKDRSSTTDESDASTSSSKTKRTIPPRIRQEVRKVYRALYDDDEDFQGWSISPGKSINSNENTRVLNKLVREVKSLNPEFSLGDIREASYRYYKTKCEEESAKRRGLEDTLKKSKRKRERLLRKRKERESAIQKNTKLSEDSKKKWMLVMKNDFMSSDDSGSDDDTYVVRPIPWRTKYVNTMFDRIDKYNAAKKSSQARRQMKSRVIGAPSSRPIPTGDVPEWAVNQDTAA